MIRTSKYHETFTKFEEYLIKRKFTHLSPDEKALIWEKNKINYFLEFESIEDREFFIKDFDPNWVNPLQSDNKNRNTNENPEKIEKKEDINFLVAYRHMPLIWVESPYSVLEKISNDPRLILIHGNYPIYLCLHALNYQFNLDKIQKSFYKFKGKGIKIGLIDSGVDQSHPDLSNQIIDVLNVTHEDNGDYNGHGTFLASIMVGTGKNSDGYYQGFCPEAKLIDIKIFNEHGFGLLSDLILALDLLIDRSPQNRPDILVFGCTTGHKDSPDHVLKKYTDLIFDLQISIVVPTGNYGPDPGYMGSPALSEKVISVGTLTDENKIAFFSGRINSEIETEKSFIKPNVVIPGTDIIASKSFISKIKQSSDTRSGYTTLSGTSISAAVVGGLLGILKQAFPENSPMELYDLLYKHSFRLPQIHPYSQGNGIPNIIKCLEDNNKLIRKPISFREAKIQALKFSSLIIFLFIIIFIIFWGV